MSAQKSLFDAPHPRPVDTLTPTWRTSDPQPSVEGAKRAAVTAGSQYDRILRYLDRFHVRGGTADEIGTFLMIERYVVASRIATLRKQGLVRSEGTRPSPKGVQVEVHHITAEGVERLHEATK